jgi:hypothetical protein
VMKGGVVARGTDVGRPRTAVSGLPPAVLSLCMAFGIWPALLCAPAPSAKK